MTTGKTPRSRYLVLDLDAGVLGYYETLAPAVAARDGHCGAGRRVLLKSKHSSIGWVGCGDGGQMGVSGWVGSLGN